ncbi:MAG: hypothetical protein QM729_09570 [Solirubrobacterales bacterium]
MGKLGRKPILLAALALAGLGAIPAQAGAVAPAAIPGMRLVFAEAPAHNYGNQVAVRVECLGAEGGFCSGTVTLSRAGQKASVPFSVRGGGGETLFVPLRLGSSLRRSAKLFGQASTNQPGSSPTATSSTLRVH